MSTVLVGGAPGHPDALRPATRSGAAAGLVRSRDPRPQRGRQGKAEGETQSEEHRLEGAVATRLVTRIRAGDREAEVQLCERYARGVLFLLKRLGASHDQAEDLRQDTFRIVLERIRDRGLDDPASLVGFVRGTARRVWLGDRRNQRRQSERSVAEPGPELERRVDQRLDPQSAAMLRQEAAAVRRVVSEMRNQRDRQILYRFYILEDDKADICADLELSSLHFNRVLFRARQRCRELLEPLRRAGLAAFIHLGSWLSLLAA